MIHLHSQNEAKTGGDTEGDCAVQELLRGRRPYAASNESMGRVDRGSGGWKDEGWKGEDHSWNDNVDKEPGDRTFCQRKLNRERDQQEAQKRVECLHFVNEQSYCS